MAERIEALNLKITATDDFSPTLNNLSTGITKLSKSGNNAPSSMSKLEKTLAGLDKTNKKVNTSLSKLNNSLGEISKQSKNSSLGLSSIGKVSSSSANGVKKLEKEISSLGKSMGKSLLKVWALIGGIKGISNIISSGIANSMEYVETLNLFTVTMGEYAETSERYANTVGELMGIDPAEWMKGQGTFDALIEGFGIGADAAAYMSQNLTQLAYDIASFENISVEEAMLKIQSGLAGEIEPMRRIGYDLSQNRLTQIAQNIENYGTMTYSINEMTGAVEGFSTALDSNSGSVVANFNDLTQAEKVQLRYIAMLQEMEFVQGDMARSLNDPANQIRIFRSQLQMCSRELGNLFIPAINKVLPYLIAMSQVLREVLSAVAALLGFTLPDMSDRMDVGSAVGGYEDIEDAMGGAAASAKKLRDYTIGIDELNVLRPDDNNGGSGNNSMSAGGGSFALPSYDFIGDATNSRIAQIKEQIEDFLQSVQDGTLKVGQFIGDLFNKLVSKWDSPFLDGAKFGQRIADGIAEANRFLDTANTFILGHKIGEWIAGTVQGSDFVYEATSFVFKFLGSSINFVGGILAGLDISNTGSSILRQITEAIVQPFSDAKYNGHFENGEWVIACGDLSVEFNTVDYALKHPLTASIGDWWADFVGIGDRYDNTGAYVGEVPFQIRLKAWFGGLYNPDNVLITALGDWIGDMLNIDNRYDMNGNYVEEVPLDIHFRAILGGFYNPDGVLYKTFGDLINDLFGVGDRFDKNGNYVEEVSLTTRIMTLQEMTNPFSFVAGQLVDGLTNWWTNTAQPFLASVWDEAKIEFHDAIANLLEALGALVGSLGFNTDWFDEQVERQREISYNLRFGDDGNDSVFGGLLNSDRVQSLIDLRNRQAEQQASEIQRHFSSFFPNFGNAFREQSYQPFVNHVRRMSVKTGQLASRDFADSYSNGIASNKAEFERAGNTVSDSLSRPLFGVGKLLSDDFSKGYVNGINGSNSAVSGAINNLKNNSVSTLRSGLSDRMNEAGNYGVNGFSKAFTTGTARTQVNLNIDTMKTNVTSRLRNGLSDKFYEAGNYGVSGFAKALINSPAYKSVVDNAKAMAQASVDAVKAQLQIHSPSVVMKEVGENFAQGMSDGVKQTEPLITKQVGATTENVVKDVATKTKQALKIHSPSKIFEEIGGFTAEGFTIGFENEAKNTYKVLDDFANTVKNVDVANVYNPMSYTVAPQSTTTAVSGSQTESMSNMAMLVYDAVNTALQGNRNDSANASGDTKIYINGREIFKVVQEESRKNGVAISNGAFIGG